MVAAKLVALVAFGTQVVSGYDKDGCTSIVVSSGATVDGSAMASHSDDCSDCDWRMAYVPARDHAPGSRRHIHDGSWGQYPRLVDPERSSIYTPGAGINETLVVGSIPQVPHTYALWESSYALMNEHGLGMGESTCAAFLVNKGPKDGGSELLAIRSLMMLGLERCVTARCAIQTMGDLAAQYGFYGEDPGMGGAGEAVTIVDRSGEAWVFHVTGGVAAKTSEQADRWAGQRGALWAAQRVPDGHIAVVANVFIIKEIDTSDSKNFMVHPGLFDMAREAGLWDGREPFNFQKHMMPEQTTFEDPPNFPPIPMYGTLRTWGVFRHAAPSANISISQYIGHFPFSIQVDRLVDHKEVFRWFRESFYEGTEFDMTQGALAGPFQSPNRVEGGHGMAVVKGQFARAISIHRTSYTQVVQSGTSQPMVWFAPDKASTSVFVPFFASALKQGGDGKHDEAMYGQGSMKSFSFTDGMPPAWWAFDFVANWMDLCYRNMSLTYVYPAVRELQATVDVMVQDAVKSADKARGEEAAAVLAEAQTKIQREVVKSWWELAGKLVVRYNDMSFNFPEHAPTITSSVGLPPFWLEMIGFDNEAYYPKWIQPASAPPTLLPAEERAGLVSTAELERTGVVEISVSTLMAALVAAVATAVSAGVVGYRVGIRGQRVSQNDDSAYARLVQ